MVVLAENMDSTKISEVQPLVTMNTCTKHAAVS